MSRLVADEADHVKIARDTMPAPITTYPREGDAASPFTGGGFAGAAELVDDHGANREYAQELHQQAAEVMGAVPVRLRGGLRAGAGVPATTDPLPRAGRGRPRGATLTRGHGAGRGHHGQRGAGWAGGLPFRPVVRPRRSNSGRAAAPAPAAGRWRPLRPRRPSGRAARFRPPARPWARRSAAARQGVDTEHQRPGYPREDDDVWDLGGPVMPPVIGEEPSGRGR
ncbi:hypothetical protein SAMN05421810_107136 [Amycolatopsis arida]|uniref:Uncharacterized protein n=1 Tax=Amycolatopsis arida TaxID=587909 RepID=A0A1I5YG27_9PSEU|nr:hypothetical protein [Amycolatopsis arida]TDX90490.1 hypothetical protein CLV69_107136 [Amycolatopsis arida]SFQ43191.1 hypothetical protein SAMN05421810_107136 [Amycolatopsis arida]